MKVIGYIRVSTDGQEASGLSLEAQEAKIRAYCDLYGLDLVAIHRDAASGKSLNREGLQGAFAAVRQGLAAGIIVAKLDRLTRNVRDLGELLEAHFSKCHLYVVAEQVDTTTAAGRLVLNLLTSVAQWERETIGERTSEALRAKKRRGEKTGGAIPFGYDCTDGKLVENEQEQFIIRQVEELRRQGFGYKAIAKALNERGHCTKQGSPWCQVTVGRIVKRLAA